MKEGVYLDIKLNTKGKKMKIFADSKEFFYDGIRTRWIKNTGMRYAIREDGVVLSYVNPENIKILSQSYHEKGYKKINIKYGNKVFTKRVHRLVAEAFIDNSEPNIFTEIDHKDMVKDNNHYTNLRWCTSKMNKEYMYKIKNGNDWEPQPIRTREEIEQRKIDIEIRKQERIDAMPYGSKEEMLKQTGKPIKVNDVVYCSIGDAARYISDCEPNRKYETIRTELKKMNNGKRKPGVMYGKYLIELAI